MENKETDNEQQSLFDLADEKDIDLRDRTAGIVNAEMTGTANRGCGCYFCRTDNGQFDCKMQSCRTDSS